MQRSLFEIFLSNLQQISTFSEDMFNCDYSMTCNTNRSLVFSQNKGMCRVRLTNNYVIYLKQRLLSLYYKGITVYNLRAFGKTYSFE